MGNLEELNQGVQWYVAHTYSGYESKVKASLEKIVENRGLGNLIFDIRIPVEKHVEIVGGEEKETEVKGDTVKEIEVKIYPCYVMVKMIMSDFTWHIVRNINGVTGFVGPGSRPVPLSAKEVADMGLEIADSATIGLIKELPYNVGDSVKVTGGSFSGFIGTVSSISDDRTRIMVMLNMFGRETAAEIDADSLELLTF
jgi:transcriptional antiterminator NusG